MSVVDITLKHDLVFFVVFSLRMLIGKDECAPSLTIESTLKTNITFKFMEYIRQQPIFQNRNYPTCTHKYHCIIHILLVCNNCFNKIFELYLFC